MEGTIMTSKAHDGSATFRAVGAIITCVLLNACAHSGVVKVGPDTYMIANSEWGFNSGAYEKAKAIKEGSAYCASIGREILVLDSSQNDVSFGKTPAAEVRFRCLLKGDPELTRPPAQEPQTPKQ
jgi:hypothetical protein